MSLQSFDTYQSMFRELVARKYSRADLYKECGQPGKAHPEQLPAELRVLIEMYKDLAPALVIEVGIWSGGTLYYWCKYAPEGTEIIAIDTWWFRFLQWIRTWDIDPKNILPLCANTTNQPCKDLVKEILATRRRKDDETRFILIDGGHDERTVRNDYRDLGCFVSNGIVSLHDISAERGPDHWHGIRKLWHELVNDPDKSTVAFEQDSLHGPGMFGIGVEVRDA